MNTRTQVRICVHAITSAVCAVFLAFSFSGVSASAQEAATAEPYIKPALMDEGDWTLVVIPDPQAYSRYARNQGIFELDTAWIAENKNTLNIQEVVCVGDLVESNDLQEADGYFANQTSKQMWNSVSNAFKRLDGIYPYVLCTGNHDYGPEIFPEGTHYGIRSSETRDTHFNEFFPATRNPAWKNVLVEMGTNAFGVKTLENAAYELTVPNDKKILIVSLEFSPRDETLAWAREVFARPEYRGHFGIIVTHSYLLGTNRESERIGQEGYGISKAGGNGGIRIWEKLVNDTPNIRMVISGHVSESDDFSGCCGHRVVTNAAGRQVAEILFDTQAMGGGWEGNGGDGWLQLMEFSPDMKRIRARTFSPLFAISPKSRNGAWSHEPCCEFEINLD